jgi:hypothetical protein
MPDNAREGAVQGASPDGRTLVGEVVSEPAGHGIGVLWRDGAVVGTVPDAPGGLIDLNARGEGVGNDVDGSAHHPWVYRGGVVHRLAGEGRANAIGEDGTLVGSRLASTSNGPPVAVPAMWPVGSEQPVDLPMPTKETGEATDIAGDGTIIGYVGADPYVWRPDGSSDRLPVPTGVPPNERVSALKISGSWVVGSAARVGMARWHLGAGAVQVVPGVRGDVTGYGQGNEAINAAGVVVVKNGYDAVVEGGGRTVTLPSLGPNYMNYPVSISADARVIGGMTVLNANPGSGSLDQPVSWTCEAAGQSHE